MTLGILEIDYDREPGPAKARPRLTATQQSEVAEARQSVAATNHMIMMTEVMRRGASNGEVAMTACRGGVARRSRWRRLRQWQRWHGRSGLAPQRGVKWQCMMK